MDACERVSLAASRRANEQRTGGCCSCGPLSFCLPGLPPQEAVPCIGQLDRLRRRRVAEGRAERRRRRDTRVLTALGGGMGAAAPPGAAGGTAALARRAAVCPGARPARPAACGGLGPPGGPGAGGRGAAGRGRAGARLGPGLAGLPGRAGRARGGRAAADEAGGEALRGAEAPPEPPQRGRGRPLRGHPPDASERPALPGDRLHRAASAQRLGRAHQAALTLFRLRKWRGWHSPEATQTQRGD